MTTLGSFSKVTHYLFGSPEEQSRRPPEEVADLLGEVIPGLEINRQEEPGFEVITRVRADTKATVGCTGFLPFFPPFLSASEKS